MVAPCLRPTTCITCTATGSSLHEDAIARWVGGGRGDGEWHRILKILQVGWKDCRSCRGYHIHLQMTFTWLSASFTSTFALPSTSPSPSPSDNIHLCTTFTFTPPSSHSVKYTCRTNRECSISERYFTQSQSLRLFYTSHTYCHRYTFYIMTTHDTLNLRVLLGVLLSVSSSTRHDNATQQWH